MSPAKSWMEMLLDDASVGGGVAGTLEQHRAATMGQQLADRRNAVLQTGFIFRYHPATVVARDLIARGAVGRPHTLRARMRKLGINWANYR